MGNTNKINVVARKERVVTVWRSRDKGFSLRAFNRRKKVRTNNRAEEREKRDGELGGGGEI